MRKFLMYILGGYAAGSVLFARLSAALLNRPAVLRDSPDGNPGTANAFQYGGFLCGLITLLGDVAKGFLPVYLYLRAGGNFQAAPLLSALVLAAPVWGHAFPILFRFHGGKGIAVTFGCLLGLRPATGVPFALLALFFCSSPWCCASAPTPAAPRSSISAHWPERRSSAARPE